jgi:hypothetical protein
LLCEVVDALFKLFIELTDLFIEKLFVRSGFKLWNLSVDFKSFFLYRFDFRLPVTDFFHQGLDDVIVFFEGNHLNSIQLLISY